MILRERRLRSVARNCRVLRLIRYFSATFLDLPLPSPRLKGDRIISFKTAKLMEESIPSVEERATSAKHKEGDYSPLTRRQLEAVRKYQPRRKKTGIVESLIR